MWIKSPSEQAGTLLLRLLFHININHLFYLGIEGLKKNIAVSFISRREDEEEEVVAGRYRCVYVHSMCVLVFVSSTSTPTPHKADLDCSIWMTLIYDRSLSASECKCERLCVCVSNSWEARESSFVRLSTYFTFTKCLEYRCVVEHVKCTCITLSFLIPVSSVMDVCRSWKTSFICMLISLHESFLSKMLSSIAIWGKFSLNKTNHYSCSIRIPEWLHSHKCNSRFSRWMIIAFHNVLYWNNTILHIVGMSFTK